LHAKRLVESQFSHTKFSVELRHRLLELRRVSRTAQLSAQVADPVFYPAVKDLSSAGHIFIVHEHLDAFCLQTLLKHCEIIVEQLFEYFKIVECDLVDAPVYLSHDLAGCAVCVLIIHEKEGKVCMPEVSLESVAHRQLEQAVDTLEEQTSQ